MQMRYDTGLIYVTTIDRANLGNAMDIYAAKVAEMTPELDEHMETLAIGKVIDNTLLNAGTIRPAVKGQYYATIDGKLVYYRMKNEIPPHTADSTRVLVTVGPMIQWGYDENLSTYTESDIGGSYIVALTKDNVDEAADMYAEAEYQLMDEVGTYINSLTLGTTISAAAIGASNIRTITGSASGRQYYYRPTYSIPGHRSDSTSVTITIGSSVNFGETNELGRTCDTGLQYSITITPENLSKMTSLYTEKVELLKPKLDEYITTLAIGRVITESLLGVNQTFTANQTISGETIYFKPVFTIPAHTQYDISLTVTLGSTINYGTNSNSLNTAYNLGNDYKYSITFEKDTVDHQLTIFANRLDIIKARFDDYLSSIVLGTLITKAMLETDTVHTCTVYNKVYYFTGGSFSIPGHRTDDKSVTIDIGKDLLYSENSDMSGAKIYTTTGTSPITITRSTLNSANNIYYNAVQTLGTQLANYIESTKLGTTVTPSKLGADTVRNFTTTINKRSIYYRVMYLIPAHSAGDDSVTVTMGPKIQYGPASNNMPYMYDAGEDFEIKLEFTRQNVASCNSIYTSHIPDFQNELDEYFSSLILGTKVTANMLGAGTIRGIMALNRGVYYRPEWTIPDHKETDEEVIITVGPEIRFGLTSGNLNYTYTADPEYLSVTVNNIKDPSNDYKEKVEILGEKLKTYLSSKLGTLVVSNPYYSSTYTRSQNYDVIPTTIYYDVNVTSNTEFMSDQTSGTFTLRGYFTNTSGNHTNMIDSGLVKTVTSTLETYETDLQGSITELETEMKDVFKKLLYAMRCNDTSVLNGALAPNYTYRLHNPEDTVSKTYYIAITGTVLSNWYTSGARVKVTTTYGPDTASNRTKTKFSEREFNVTTEDETNDGALDALQLVAVEKQNQFNGIKVYLDSLIGPIDDADYSYEYVSKVTGLVYYINVKYRPVDSFEPYTTTHAVVECDMTWGTTSINGPFNHKGSHFTVDIYNNTYDHYLDEIIDAANSQKLEDDLDKKVGPIVTVINEIKPLTIDVSGYSPELTIGQKTSMSINVNGGIGNKTVTCDNPFVTISNDGKIATFTPVGVGENEITFTVADESLNHDTASTTINIEVKELRIPLAIKITKYDREVYIGNTTYISVEVTGGYGDRTITCDNEEVEMTGNIGKFTPPEIGNYTITFTATDEENTSVSASVAIACKQEPRIEEDEYENDAGVTYYYKSTYIPDDNYVPYESEEVDLEIEIAYGTEPGHYDQVITTTVSKLNAINYADFKIDPSILQIQEQQEETVETKTVEDKIIEHQDSVQKAIGTIEVVDRDEAIQSTTGIQYYSKTVYSVDDYDPYFDTQTRIVATTEWGYVVDNKTYVMGTLENLETVVDATNYANYNEVVEIAIQSQKQKLEDYLDTLLGPINISADVVEYTATTTKLKYYIQTTYTVADGFTPYESTETDITVTTKWGIDGLNGPFTRDGSVSIITISNTDYATYEATARSVGENQRTNLQTYLDTLLGPVTMSDQIIPYKTKSTKIQYYIRTSFTNDDNFVPYSSTADKVTIRTYYSEDPNLVNILYTTDTHNLNNQNYNYHDATLEEDVTYAYRLNQIKEKQVEDCKIYLERMLGDLVYDDYTKIYISPDTGLEYYIKTTFTAGDCDPTVDDNILITVETTWGTSVGTYDHFYTSSVENVEVVNYTEDIEKVMAVGGTQRTNLEEYLSKLIGPLEWVTPTNIEYTSSVTGLKYYIGNNVSSSYIPYSGQSANINITTQWGTESDNLNHDYNNFNDVYKTVTVTASNYKNNAYKGTITNNITSQRTETEAYLDTLIGPLSVGEPVNDSVDSEVYDYITYYLRTVYTLPENYSPYTHTQADIKVETYWSTDPDNFNTIYYYNDQNDNTLDDRVRVIASGYPTYGENVEDLGERQREACKEYLRRLRFPEDRYYTYTTTSTNKTYYIRTLNVPKDTQNFYPDSTNSVQVTTSFGILEGNYPVDYVTLEKNRTSGETDGEVYINNINSVGVTQRFNTEQYLESIIGPLDIQGYDEDYTSELTGLPYHITVTVTPDESFDQFVSTETILTITSTWQIPGGDPNDYEVRTYPLRVSNYDNDMDAINEAILDEYNNIKTYCDSLIGNVDVENYTETYVSDVTGVSFEILITHTHDATYEPFDGSLSVDIGLNSSWAFTGKDIYTAYQCENEEHNHDVVTITKDNYKRYLSVVESTREQALECIRAYLDTLVGFINAEDKDYTYEAATGVKYRVHIITTVEDYDGPSANKAKNVNVISSWETVDTTVGDEFDRQNIIIEADEFSSAAVTVEEEMQSQKTRIEAYLDSLFGPINIADVPGTYTNSVGMKFYYNSSVIVDDYEVFSPATPESEIGVLVETRWSTNEGEYTILFNVLPDEQINHTVTLENFNNHAQTINSMIEYQQEELKKYFETLLGPPFSDEFKETYTSPVTGKTYYIITNYDRPYTFFKPDTEMEETVTTKWGYFVDNYENFWETDDYVINNTTYPTFQKAVDDMGEDQRRRLKEYLDSLIDYVNVEPASVEDDHITDPLELHLYVRVNYSVGESTPTKTIINFTTEWSLDHDTKYSHTYDGITTLEINASNYENVEEEIEKVVLANIKSVKDLSDTFIGPLPDLANSDGLTYVNLETGATWYYLKSYESEEYNYLDGRTEPVDVYAVYGLGCEGIETTIPDRFGKNKEFTLTIDNYRDTYTNSYNATIVNFAKNQDTIFKLLGPIVIPEDVTDSFDLKDGRTVYAKTMYIFDGNYEEYMTHDVFYANEVNIICTTVYGFSPDSYEYIFLTEPHKLDNTNYRTRNTDLKNISDDHMEKLRKMFNMWDIHVDDFDTAFTNMGGLEYVIRSRFIQNDVSYSANSITYSTTYALKSRQEIDDIMYDASDYTITLDEFVSTEVSNDELLMLALEKVEALKVMLDTPTITPLSTDATTYTASNGMEFVFRIAFTRHENKTNMVDVASYIDGEQYGETLTRIYHRTVEEAEEDMNLLNTQGLADLQTLCENNIPEAIDLIYPETGNFRYHVQTTFTKLRGDTSVSINAIYDGLSYVARKNYIYGDSFVEDMAKCNQSSIDIMTDLKATIDEIMPTTETVIYTNGKSKFSVDTAYSKDPDSTTVKCDIKCDGEDIANETGTIDNIKNLKDIIATFIDRTDRIKTEIVQFIENNYPSTGYEVLTSEGFNYGVHSEYIKEANSFDVQVVITVDSTVYRTRNTRFNYKLTRNTDVTAMSSIINTARNDLIRLITSNVNRNVDSIYNVDDITFRVETLYVKEADDSNVSIITRLDNLPFRTKTETITINTIRDDMSRFNTIAVADYNELVRIVNTAPASDYNEVKTIDNFEYKCGVSYYKIAGQQNVTVQILLDEDAIEEYVDVITNTTPEEDIVALRTKAGTKVYNLLQSCKGILDVEQSYKNGNMEFTLDIIYIRGYGNKRIFFKTTNKTRYIDVTGDKTKIFIYSLVDGIQYQSVMSQQFNVNSLNQYKEDGQNQLQLLKSLIDSMNFNTEEVYDVNGFSFNITTLYKKYRDHYNVDITVQVDGVTAKTGSVAFNPNTISDITNMGNSLVRQVKDILDTCPVDFEREYSPDLSNFGFLIGGMYRKQAGDNKVYIDVTLDKEPIPEKQEIKIFNINTINTIKADTTWLESQLDQSPDNNTEDYHITRENNKVDCHFYISREYNKEPGNKEVTTTILLDGQVYGNTDVRDYDVFYPTETKDYADSVVADLKDKLDTVILSDINTVYKKYGFDFNIEVYFTKPAGAKDITVSYKIEKKKQLNYGDLSEIETIDI